MPEPLSRDEVQTLVHNGAVLVEVLGSREYEEAHLPSAINVPLAKLIVRRQQIWRQKSRSSSTDNLLETSAASRGAARDSWFQQFATQLR